MILVVVVAIYLFVGVIVALVADLLRNFWDVYFFKVNPHGFIVAIWPVFFVAGICHFLGLLTEWTGNTLRKMWGQK